MRRLFTALLFIILAVPVFAGVPTGYPPTVQAAINAVCYDPALIRTQIPSMANVPIVYKWYEPRNLGQLTIYQTRSEWTYANVAAFVGPYCSITFGQWLTSGGYALTGNPYLNATYMLQYIVSSIDVTAYTVAKTAQMQLDIKNSCLNAGVPASDARCNVSSSTNRCYNTSDTNPYSCVALVQHNVAMAQARDLGPNSFEVSDVNGITLADSNSGLAPDSVERFALSGTWVKPTDCQPGVSPLSTPTPAIVSPTPTPTTTPSQTGALMCIDPSTGQCKSYPTIFGHSCDVFGTIPCGVTPAPTPTPTATPIAPPDTIVGCLSADGRYSYAASSCKTDEIPLVKKN